METPLKRPTCTGCGRLMPLPVGRPPIPKTCAKCGVTSASSAEASKHRCKIAVDTTESSLAIARGYFFESGEGIANG